MLRRAGALHAVTFNVCPHSLAAHPAQLHRSLLCSHEAVVDLLLARGANVTIENGWGWNALHFAASSGRETLVRTLMLAGLSPTQLSGQMQTPTSYAFLDEPLTPISPLRSR